MSEEKEKKREKGFFARLIEKIDRKLEEKAAAPRSCCCCSSDQEKKTCS